METVLLYVLGVVVMLVGVALSIALHEVGHLVPAKKFGVRVGQYMIGFGPTLWSRKFGETEYGLKAVPLGGYISMSGMYPPAKGETASRDASTGFLQTLMQDARDQSVGPKPIMYWPTRTPKSLAGTRCPISCSPIETARPTTTTTMPRM